MKSKYKKIVIFGNNDLSKLLEHYLNNENKRAIRVLNKNYLDSSEQKTSGCYPIEDIINEFGEENIAAYVCVGYNKMNTIRKTVFEWLKKNKIEILTYVHPSCVLSSDVVLGEGNILLECVTIQPFVKLGNGNIIFSNSVISHHCSIGDFNYLAPNVVLSGRVRLLNNCFCGANCTFKNDVVVNDYCLIGAGAYVSNDLPESNVLIPERSKIISVKSNQINLI